MFQIGKQIDSIFNMRNRCKFVLSTKFSFELFCKFVFLLIWWISWHDSTNDAITIFVALNFEITFNLCHHVSCQQGNKGQKRSINYFAVWASMKWNMEAIFIYCCSVIFHCFCCAISYRLAHILGRIYSSHFVCSFPFDC